MKYIPSSIVSCSEKILVALQYKIHLIGFLNSFWLHFDFLSCLQNFARIQNEPMKLHASPDSCKHFSLKVAFKIHTGIKLLSQIAKSFKASQL